MSRPLLRTPARLLHTAAVSTVLISSAPVVHAAEVQLNSPRGGWSVSGLVDDSDQAAASYPYNLIDRGQQKYRTLIKGQLDLVRQATQASQAAKQSGSAPTTPPTNTRGLKAPYQLVVNGNPMPLYTGPDGTFVRPYAFGPGSNSVEIKAPSGRPGKRVQFVERNHSRALAAMRVILSWDDNQAEVDLHVITPDGQHAFWGNPVLQGGGGLDVDSVDGAGPEMFSITAPRPGVYHFYVNYWGNFGDSGYHFDERTRQKPVIMVLMTVITRENTPYEKRETYTMPLRNIGDLIPAKSLAWR